METKNDYSLYNKSFAFYDKIKKHEQPSWYKNFWVILLVELIGTFLMVFGILLPDTADFLNASGIHNGSAFWGFVKIIYTPYIMRAAWVALVIFIVVIPAIRISANFNPAVTIVEIGKGHDSMKLGVSKIVIQFIGALIAAWVAYGVAAGMGTLETTILDAIKPAFNHYDWSGDKMTYTSQTFYEWNQSWYWFIQLIMEFILTFSLLTTVFWFGKKTYIKRTILISSLVVFIVAIGIRTGTFALNPARAFAPAFVVDVMDLGVSGFNYTPYILMFIFMEVTASFVFILVDRKKIEMNSKYVIYTENKKNLVAAEKVIEKEINEPISTIREIALFDEDEMRTIEEITMNFEAQKLVQELQDEISEKENISQKEKTKKSTSSKDDKSKPSNSQSAKKPSKNAKSNSKKVEK